MSRKKHHQNYQVYRLARERLGFCLRHGKNSKSWFVMHGFNGKGQGRRVKLRKKIEICCSVFKARNALMNAKSMQGIFQVRLSLDLQERSQIKLLIIGGRCSVFGFRYVRNDPKVWERLKKTLRKTSFAMVFHVPCGGAETVSNKNKKSCQNCGLFSQTETKWEQNSQGRHLAPTQFHLSERQ